MSFLSRIFENKENKTSNHNDESLSKKLDFNQKNSVETQNNKPEYLLVLSGYYTVPPKTVSLEDIKRLNIIDTNNKKINFKETTEDEVEEICKIFFDSIWGCGVGYPEKITKENNKKVRTIILKEKGLGNPGYKEKFQYFYKLGYLKTMMEGKGEFLSEINFKSPEEYLTQISEKEISFGIRIKEISDRTKVLFIGPRNADFYMYKDFVNVIFEGIPIKIVNIFFTVN